LYPEGYDPAPGTVVHGCFASYKASSTYSSRLTLTDNLLTGGVTLDEGGQAGKGIELDNVGEPVMISNLADALNCMPSTGTGSQQRFCPPELLPVYLAAALLSTLAVALTAIVWFRRLGRRQRAPFAGPNNQNAFGRSFAPLKLRRAVNAPWFTAAAISIGWNLFVMTPAFERTVVAGLSSGSTTPLVSVLVRNLGATLQPVAWGTILL
jgi:hypothetical protein